MMNFPIPPPSYFTPPSMSVPVPNNFTLNQRFLKPGPEKNLNNPNSYVIQPPQMSYGTPPPSPFPRLPVGIETQFSNPPVLGQGNLYRPGYVCQPPECPPAQPLYQQPPAPPQMCAQNVQLSCPPAVSAGPAAAAPGQEIPDLRPQFLTTQYRGQPGQVVVLPPLQGDGSLQTIQILTPAHSTNSTQYSAHSTPYTVQTIVLPIMKLQPASTQPTPEQVQEDTAEDSILASTSTSLVSSPAEEEMYLNKIDGTGLPSVMQGIDLDQVKQFAAEFKAARIRLGLTQTQVGQALNSSQVVEDQAACVSQSTICRFEKLEITALQVKKLLPALQSWLAWAQRRQAEGLPVLVQDGVQRHKRKRRTVFNQETVAALVAEFEQNSSPTGGQLSDIADRLGLDRETTRVWFCNKRQQSKKLCELIS